MFVRRLLVIVTILGLLFVPKIHAQTSCPANDKNYGQVELAVPKLGTAGAYNIWTRMQAASQTNNQYLLNVNGASCYKIGGSSLEPSQWQWVYFQDGNLNQKVVFDFNRAEGNSLKLIGVQTGVKISHIMLTKSDCIPIEYGNNCAENGAAIMSASGNTSSVPPLTGDSVSGNIFPTQLIIAEQTNIAKVIYFVHGKTIPSSKNFSLDTSLVPNGAHRIAIQITKKNGDIINQETSITVSNLESILSPAIRWARLNRNSLATVGVIAGGVLVLVSIFHLIKHLLLKRRLMMFRGF